MILEIASFLLDFLDCLTFMNPREDLLFILLDLLCTYEHVVCYVAWHYENSVNVSQDHITRLDGHIADLDRNLVVCDEASAKRTVADAILIEYREVGLKDLMCVTDTAVDACSLYFLSFCGRCHHTTPKSSILVT